MECAQEPGQQDQLTLTLQQQTVARETEVRRTLKVTELHEIDTLMSESLITSRSIFFLLCNDHLSVVLQGDCARERLSEQQYRRLVDYVTRASQFLSPSATSLQLQPPVTLAEPPPSVTKSYRYLVDPAFSKVFVSKFAMVKNKAMRIGFH